MNDINDPEDVQRPADARDDEPVALANFLDKWRARWPEWSVAEVFIPAGQRPLVLAWATLQQELADAAWGGADPRPGVAKLGWWQEELIGWKRGARRHPLGTVLQAHPAPWDRLAAALPGLADSRERPVDAREAFAVLMPFAQVVAEIEAVLFAVPGSDPDARLIAAALLHARFAQPGDNHVPLDMLARAGSGDPSDTWARELRQQWPTLPAGNRPRRLWTALACQRLRQHDAVQPLPAWKALWVVWRAARR
ncbi:MAG: phytoene/squalene synthase family protein [Lysobacter sp.]